MYIDMLMSQTQTALIVLKLVGMFPQSWWFVFLPSIIWVVGGVILSAVNRSDPDEDQ